MKECLRVLSSKGESDEVELAAADAAKRLTDFVEVEAQKVHGRRQELRRGGTAYLRQCVRRVGWEPRGGRHVWRSHRRHDERDTDEQAISERKHGVAPQRKRRRLLRAEELRKELVLPPGC